MNILLNNLRQWLSRLSFRTGVIVLLCCIPCYILSFAQMALPISTTLKSVLWFILFGMAKTLQYGGLTILGVEGVKRLKKISANHKLMEFDTLTLIVGIMEYKVCKKMLFLFKHSNSTVQIIKNDSLLFVLYNNSLNLHNQSTKVTS